jgi:putative nucleotidyltransferase with HDIG domain
MDDEVKPMQAKQVVSKAAEIAAPARLGINDEHAQWINSLHFRVNELAYTENLQELLNKILDLLTEAVRAEAGTYFQLDPETGELMIAAMRGDEESKHLIGLRLPQQEGLLQAQGINQPIVIGDLPGDPRWLRAASPQSAARMVNLISLPLIAPTLSSQPDRVLGVAQLYNYQHADLHLLEMLRSRFAVEIERRQLLDSTLHSNRRLFALIEAIGQVAGTLDRKQLLQLITEQAAELVDAERSSVFLVDPVTQEMMFQMAYQPEPGRQSAQTRHARPKIHPSLPSPSTHPARDKGEFRLFTRAAITVPINLPPTSDQSEKQPRHLGGLMAINRSGSAFQPEDVQLLEILSSQASTFLQVAELYESTEELFLDAIRAMVAAIDAKDPYTQGHSSRVSEYSVLIAQELGLSDAQINHIRIGSLLHDVGKIGIPDAILQKKGKLTPEEYKVMKNHSSTGFNILKQVKMLEPALPAIIEHHELLDGSGYPFGLRGEQISIMGRIVTVADIFDAMTSDRPYRPALSVPEVMAHLEQNAGILFDPACVHALHNILDRSEYEELAAEEIELPGRR